MSRYRDQVAAALEAVTIRGPTRYSWLGRASRPLHASLDAHLDESERRRYLVSCLREELYASFYCYGLPVPARWGEPEPASPDPWLTEALSQANSGHGSWEPGWKVLRLEPEEAVVATTRLRARVPLDACRSRAGAVRPGAAVSVRLPKELPDLSPGFHTVVSDAPVDFASAGSVVRVYWNVSPDGAPKLVSAVTSLLNREGSPFRLKVADHPVRLERCDAAVLYLGHYTFTTLGGVLRQMADMVSPHLLPEIPAFTLMFAPGVGLAEGDREGGSFGARRCGLLADAIVRAHMLGVTGTDARVETVAQRFEEDGVRIDAPYLEPSLADRHVL